MFDMLDGVRRPRAHQRETLYGTTMRRKLELGLFGAGAALIRRIAPSGRHDTSSPEGAAAPHEKQSPR
jgi:hypothetical protein